MHCLAVDPAGYAFKWDELHVLFQEAHAVVNEYRPHQARETLIVMMEEQVKRAREEERGAKEMVERVKTVLRGLARGDGDGDGDGDLGREAGKEEGEERRVWEVVGREVGYVWYLEFSRKKGGWVGAISTDTISVLSSSIATSRILVPRYGHEYRVMLWPPIKNPVSCVCKPPPHVQHPRTLSSSRSFSSPGN